MGLKQRKFIQNSNITLPHFDVGKEGAAEPGNEPGKVSFGEKLSAGLQGVMGLVQMAAQYSDASNPNVSSQDMLRKGAVENIDGESFQRTRVDGSAVENVRARTTGNVIGQAAAGASTLGGIGKIVGGDVGEAVATGIGGAIGSVFGFKSSSEAERKAEEMKRKAEISATNSNVYAYDKTFTKSLRKKYANRVGDDDSQQLIVSARNGFEPQVNPLTNETIRQYKVDTAGGMSYDTANAFGKKNEQIWRIGTELLHKIKRGPNDDAKLHLNKKRDVIFPDDIINPFTGKSFAKSAPQAKREGWLPELLSQQIFTKNLLGFYNNNKGGQLPHAATGWENASWITGGLLTSLPGVIAGINQLQASNDDISSPSSYVAPNTQKYQNDLDSLDINMFPIYQANREATSISNSRIAQSGGLSAGQQMLGYLTNAMNERDSISKALTNAQMQRNAYRAEAAKVGIDTELRRAAQQQNAQQWDYAQEAASHNAKIQANQMGWYNLSNALGNAYKNMWDYYQFNKIYDIYAQDVNSRKQQKDKPFTPEEQKKAVQDALKIPQTKTPFSPTNVPDIKVPEAASDIKPQYNVSPGIDKFMPEPWLPSFRGPFTTANEGEENVYVERKPFKIGSTGDDVKLIQQKLGINDDGKYGRTTRQKVIEWQRKHGLKRDGVVGENTWKSLVGTQWSGFQAVPYEDRNHPYGVYFIPGWPNGTMYTRVTPHKKDKVI